MSDSLPFSNTGTAAVNDGTLRFAGAVAQLVAGQLTGWRLACHQHLNALSSSAGQREKRTINMQGIGPRWRM